MVSPDGVIRERSLPTVNPGTGPYQWGNCGYTWWCNQGMKTISIKISPCSIYMDSLSPSVSTRLWIQVQGCHGRKNKLSFGTGVSPSRERSLLTVNPDMGPTIRGNCLAQGLPSGVIREHRLWRNPQSWSSIGCLPWCYSKTVLVLFPLISGKTFMPNTADSVVMLFENWTVTALSNVFENKELVQ